MKGRRSGVRTRSGARHGATGSRSLATKMFLSFLGIIAVAYLAIIAYYTSAAPQSAQTDRSSGLLEECRELCLKYGLISTGDIATDAKAYLDAARQNPQLPGTPNVATTVPQQPNNLIGRTAPNFELADADGQKVSLRDLRRNGPVIVVFYYGYFCSHCVAQLFGLEQDLPKFTRHGARIVALSPDPATETAAKFRKYGRFHFPVLADPDNRVARDYGVCTSVSGSEEVDRKHGTFLVDREGRIRWACSGYQPFVDNDLLLKQVESLTSPDKSDPAPRQTLASPAAGGRAPTTTQRPAKQNSTAGAKGRRSIIRADQQL